MSLRTTTRNGSLSNVEWSNDVANISVEPISLIERRRRLPSVNKADGEEDGQTMVRKFREKMRVETDLWSWKGHLVATCGRYEQIHTTS